jgi:hypothetical protein
VGFVVDKVALGQVFSPSTSVLPCQFHSTGAQLQGKTKKLIIFITGLHNKLQGCGASVASAAGLFNTHKERKRLQKEEIKCNMHVLAWDETCIFSIVLTRARDLTLS